MIEKKFTFWQKNELFLNELKNFKVTDQKHFIVNNDLSEEREDSKKEIEQFIAIYSEHGSQSELLSSFIKNNAELIFFDKLEDDFLIKQTANISNYDNMKYFNNIFNFKYLEQSKNNINLFFKLQHMSKFSMKFKRAQQRLLVKTLTKQLKFFKASQHIINRLLKKFILASFKTEVKFTSRDLYGVVVAMVPLKGFILYNGLQRFFLPMSKISSREVNKNIHLKQCLLFNSYLMYNTIKFIVDEPRKNFYRKKHKRTTLHLVDYKKI